MSDLLDLTPRLRGPAGRKVTRVEIRGPVTEDDLRLLAETPKRAMEVPRLQTLRESHHRLARCLALGLDYAEAGHQTGYSINRISLLKQDPSFRDLIEVYKKDMAAGRIEHNDIMLSNAILGERLVNDGLHALAEREEPLTLGELRVVNELIADRNDRVGYPKHAVDHKVNHDLAARLEAGRRRAKLTENQGAERSSAVTVGREWSPGGGSASQESVAVQDLTVRSGGGGLPSVSGEEPVNES